MARDGSPHAITGASVPPDGYADFQHFTAPLINLNPKFPFALQKSDFPNVRPENVGGTDIVSYGQAGIPILINAGPRNPHNNHNYQHIWHTVYDTYDDVLKFAEHQQHAAICQAVISYGVAELPNQLSRDTFYLQEGLYADIIFGTMESPKRVMVRLDPDGAPEQVAHFLAAVEGKADPFRGGLRANPAAAQAAARTEPLATISVSRHRFFEAKLREAMPQSAALSRIPNRSLKSEKGLLGFAPDGFAVAARANVSLPGKYTPIGSIIATDALETLKPSDPLRSLRIIRVGDSAKAFKAAEAANN
jgi:hypothetical protein